MAWSTILSEQEEDPGEEVGIQGYWPELQFNQALKLIFYPAYYGIT